MEKSQKVTQEEISEVLEVIGKGLIEDLPMGKYQMVLEGTADLIARYGKDQMIKAKDYWRADLELMLSM